MRIAVAIDRRTLNGHYRAFQPVETLANRGNASFAIHHPEEPGFFKGISAADAVLVYRYSDEALREMLRRLRAGGTGIVWDNDDDITAIPRSNPLYRRFGGVRGQQLRAAIGRMIRMVDVVTTPSTVLAEKFALQGARDVRVMENWLPVEFLRARAAKHAGTVLIWVAALEHQVDYEGLRLRPVLERLLESHDDLRVVSVGLGLGLTSPRYEHVPSVPFADLANTIASADIGIAPLLNIPWNRARSNVKLKEYAVAGVPWLASPVGAYRSLGEKQGGHLVADDEWYDAIERLLQSDRDRKALAKRARKWAEGETIAKHVHRWEAVFEQAIASARRAALSA